MRVVLIGPPGAGKGTQAVFIANHFAIPQISTGDIFRANVGGATELGKLAKKYLDAGELVPDETTNAMVAARLAEPDARDGFLLDGYPRTVAQAGELERMLAEMGSQLDAALELRVDNDEVVRRLSGRRTCSQCGQIWQLGDAGLTSPDRCGRCGGPLTRRDDDNPETVRRRLEVYAAQTAPLIEFYRQRGRLAPVEAMGAVEEVTARAVVALGPFGPGN